MRFFIKTGLECKNTNSLLGAQMSYIFLFCIFLKNKHYKMKNIIYSTLILLSLKSFSQDRITGELFSTRSEVIAENGMVAQAIHWQLK